MSKKLKKLPDEEVWTRWTERMTRIRHELHYVYGTRRRFNDVTALFERNDKLKAVGGDVYDWMFRMWARDIVIAIRRELDNDTNTVCLGRLLGEMAQRPKVITRAVPRRYSRRGLQVPDALGHLRWLRRPSSERHRATDGSPRPDGHRRRPQASS